MVVRTLIDVYVVVCVCVMVVRTLSSYLVIARICGCVCVCVMVVRTLFSLSCNDIKEEGDGQG